ncbi:hypothetical protein [Serratia fonticola]|jgi:putative intracellular protease/amidase|uniref:hypothetical protein n=1 Tax=Serratia fonticola TaxID=47917 RepID=UPI00217998F9|nr:hypothetical protein [Serratia fonticola]CAI1687713.1 Uncharacterised protein [Serratia fonticola]
MAQRILFVLTSHDRKGPADFQVQVVVSESLVTGQNPASAKGVAEAMLPLLVSSAYGRE